MAAGSKRKSAGAARSWFRLARTTSGVAGGGIFAVIVSLIWDADSSPLNARYLNAVFSAFVFLMIVSAVAALVGMVFAAMAGPRATGAGALALGLAIAGSVIAVVEVKSGIPHFSLFGGLSSHNVLRVTVGQIGLAKLFVAIAVEAIVTGGLVSMDSALGSGSETPPGERPRAARRPAPGGYDGRPVQRSASGGLDGRPAARAVPGGLDGRPAARAVPAEDRPTRRSPEGATPDRRAR